MRLLFLTLVSLLFVPAGANAGAWVPEQGSGYHQLGFSTFEATDVFGTNPDFTLFEKNAVTYYGEFGLGNRTGLFYSIPVQNISQVFAGQETSSSGIADVDIGLRYNWYNRDWILSSSFLFKAPYFYDEDDALPRGNGQEDYEFRMLLGKSLNQYGYFNVEAGYRFRSDEPSDEFRYLLEYGFNATQDWYFRTKLDGLLSAGNASATTNNNLALVPEFDLGNLELTSGYVMQLEGKQKLGIEFTWTGAIYGDDILRGNNYQLALIYQH